MKRVFLILTVLLMFGSSVFAGGGLDFGIGPKLGYQTAMLSYNKADIKNSFLDHTVIGVFGRIGFGKIYVQPEILYFRTSSLFNVDYSVDSTTFINTFNVPSGADVNFTLNSMNIQVPVLVGVKVLDTKLVTLRAQAGPTASFVIKSTPVWGYSTSEGANNEIANTELTDLVDTKSIAWGMQAGLGADFIGKITLDINYNFGLSRVFNKMNNTSLGQYFDFNNVDNTKQSMFMVTVGYKFL